MEAGVRGGVGEGGGGGGEKAVWVGRGGKRRFGVLQGWRFVDVMA